MARSKTKRNVVPDVRRRILAHFVLTDTTGIVGINVPELLQHLLLFEGVTIKSGRILDLGHLVRMFGLDDALAAIRATGVKVHCDPSNLVRVGEPTVRVGKGGSLRLERLDYGIVRFGSQAQWLDSGFKEAVAIAGLTAGRAKKFENVVRGLLIPEDVHSREVALEEARRDLLSVSPATRAALDVALRQRCGVGLPPAGSFRFDIHHQDGRGYVAETDLPIALGLPPDKVAAAVNVGLLGAVGINTLLDDIRVHEAVVGMQEAELSVLNHKLASLASHFDGGLQADRLTRVVDLVHLPNIGDEAGASRANLRRLLDARESDECKAFRAWLSTSDEITDAEIKDRFQSVGAKLGSMIRSGPGKGIRWALGTGAGLLWPIVGTVASILDTFVVERLLPNRGPLSFLGDRYTSIFEKAAPDDNGHA